MMEKHKVNKKNVKQQTQQVYERYLPLPQQMFAFNNRFDNTLMTKLPYLRTTSQAIHLTIEIS